MAMGTIFDLHLHTTRYSNCSRLSPRAAIKRAAKMALDGIVITEHDTPWGENEIEELAEIAKDRNLKVLVGQELRGYREDGSIHGDLLTFGFHDKIEYRPSPREIIDTVHQEGGVALAAHPFRSEFGLEDDVYKLELDGIEVLSPHHLILDTMKAERVCEELKIAGIGGSDAHSKREVGKFLTYFENEIKSEKDLVAEIKAKRCKPVSYREAVKLRT